MNRLPTPDEIRARIDEDFPPERRRRALAWAKTPEGRAALAAHAEQLGLIPKPVDPCAPENVAVPLHTPTPQSRVRDLGGYAAVGAWWLLAAVSVAGWLYAVDRWPQLWGGA